MEPLRTLARLAGHEVDAERRALAALDEQIGQQQQQIDRARAEAEHELQAAVDLAGARLLTAYLEGHRQRLQAAETALRQLEGARAAQLARVIAQRLEVKRLELLQTRQDRRRRVEVGRRERKGLDEQALLRHRSSR